MQKILERPSKAACGVRAEVGASSAEHGLVFKDCLPPPSALSLDGYPADHSTISLTALFVPHKVVSKQLPTVNEAMQVLITPGQFPQCYTVIEYPQMGEPFNGKKAICYSAFWGFYIFTFAKLSRKRNRRLSLWKLINSISDTPEAEAVLT